MRALIAATCILASATATALRSSPLHQQQPGAALLSAGAEMEQRASPDDTVCIVWTPYTEWNTLNNVVPNLAGITQSYLVGNMADPCNTCSVWGDVLPCFATDSGVNLFGHRDYNREWITHDYCRVDIGGTTYYSDHMMLPVAGPKAQSLQWMSMKIGDQVPANVVKYGNIVLAQTLDAPSGCCAGKGFSGYAEISSNGTLLSVHIAVFLTGHKLDSFNVAVCTDYHPVTTAAPTGVPPTPAPTPKPLPTLPPTPVPQPPATPAPTQAPNSDWNIITRQFCMEGCSTGGDNCTTLLHRNGVCEEQLNGNSVMYTCGSSSLQIDTYRGPGCQGSAQHSEQQGVDTCVQTPSLQYIYNKCMQVKPPQSGLKVTKKQCVEGCDYECSTTDKGPVETCEMEEPIYGSRGPTEYLCFDSFIARTHYFANACGNVTESTLTITTVQPRDQCVPINRNTAYETYKCESN